jgi:hypothetical protein
MKMNKLLLFLFFLMAWGSGYSQTMTLTSINPSIGASGNSITLTGTNLSNTINVFFGTTASIIQSISSTTIIATAPNLPNGSYCVYASTGHVNSNCLNFNYGPTSTPTSTPTGSPTSTPTSTLSPTPTSVILSNILFSKDGKDNTSAGLGAGTGTYPGNVVSTFEDAYFGNMTGSADTSGGANAVFGATSLYTSTNPNGNSLIGAGILKVCVSCIDNDLGGIDVGQAAVTVLQDVIHGADADYNCSTCENSVVEGFESSYSTTFMNASVHIGEDSGYNATNTSFDLMMGYASGFTATGPVTGDVFIGPFSGQYELGSNAFYVNNQDRTNTTNEKLRSLMYGTFNATAASQTLNVNAQLTCPYTITGTNFAVGATPTPGASGSVTILNILGTPVATVTANSGLVSGI